MKRSTYIATTIWLLTLLSGCFSSERDNAQDPINTPILEMGSVVFNQTDGVVDVTWSYIGQGEIPAFRVQRHIDSGFSDVGSVGGPPAGQFERRALSFRDTDVPAGERLFYRIRILLDGRDTGTEARSLQIPGAQLVSVTPDPLMGRIRVGWRIAGGDVSRVSLVRVLSGVESLVFASPDPSVRVFFDGPVVGGEVYQYFVRSDLPGITLDSRSKEVRIWAIVGDAQLGDPASERTLIYVQNGSGLSVYRHGPTETIDQQYQAVKEGDDPVFDNPRNPLIRQDRDLIPATLSVDIPSKIFPITVMAPVPNGPPVTTEANVLISGITSETDEVVVRVQTPGSFFLTSQSWTRPVGATKTRVSIDASSGLIYVSAGLELRVFSVDFIPAGVFDLPEEPVAIEARSTSLWMVFSSGGLFHGEVTMANGIPTGIVWTEVRLADGAVPVAVVTNEFRQVFVLDTGLRRVQVLDPDGTILFYWSLPEGSFDSGQIEDATFPRQVFLMDDDGVVHVYVP